MMQPTKKNCLCKKEVARKEKPPLPLLLSLLIAILPKCPFCAFGYSCVVTMCSGAKLHQYTPNAYGIIPVILAFILILSFLFNYKGRKTQIAMALAVIGTGLVSLSQFITGSPPQYFMGTGLIFFSVFYNGSFLHFWQRFSHQFQSKNTY